MTYVHRFPFVLSTLVTLASGAWVSHAQEQTQPGGPSVGLPGTSTFAIRDSDPVSSVPTAEQAQQKPLEMGYFLMELSDRAQAAQARGEHKQAAQYFRAMAKAVPDRATGFSKACAAHAAASEWDLALEVCRVALATEGVTTADLVRFVQVMLQQPRALGPRDIEEMDAVLARLNQEVNSTKEAELALRDLECQVAVRLEDERRLRTCDAAMTRLAPNTPKTLMYAAAAAMAQGNWSQADRVIARARQAGLPPAAMNVLEQAVTARRPKDVAPIQQVPRTVWLAAAVVALLACIALLVASYRRRALTSR